VKRSSGRQKMTFEFVIAIILRQMHALAIFKILSLARSAVNLQQPKVISTIITKHFTTPEMRRCINTKCACA